MEVKEIEAKSLLRKSKKVDTWFLSRYNLNLYRGCQHGCGYCDGQSEDYYVEGDFHNSISVKKNAPAILTDELQKIKKGKSSRGVIVAGGGISDSYQPLEKRYTVTRKCLKIIHNSGHPVHVITKSKLVERDLDVIQQINEKNGAVVSMSFSSVDDDISKILEPLATLPSARLDTLKKFKEHNITTGLLLLPVIPFITDTDEMIERVFIRAKEYGLDFVLFGGMTLKEGRQKENFYSVLRKFYPEKENDFNTLYPGSKYGNTKPGYADVIHNKVLKYAVKYNISLRLPYYVFNKSLTAKEKLIIILEHLYYFHSLIGKRTNYGRAALQVNQMKDELNSFSILMHQDKFDKASLDIIHEFIHYGRVKMYDDIIQHADEVLKLETK